MLLSAFALSFRAAPGPLRHADRAVPVLCLLYFLVTAPAHAQETRWLSYPGGKGPGQHKHIVLISGDEEYRSEESLPLLAKILSDAHGFRTTVLFATDPGSGIVNPENQTHIAGMQHLETADLVVLLTRFRELPDADMKYFDLYLKSGKPVVALRTSTHAFAYSRNKQSPYAKYSFDHTGSSWPGGFGKEVLGETWVAHHGSHGKEGTRALVNGLLEKHEILRGVSDIWGETDVYTIRRLPADARVLLFGQTTLGMTPDAPLSFSKSLMPVAWIREYTHENGKKSRVFATTLGTAMEFTRPDMRRLIVNACYWATGLEPDISPEARVDFKGTYNPSMFGFGKHKKGLKPAGFEVR